ncbi:FecR domain-containing protein [uncultured Cohaesibacter sp.]|uniref:FecR family protein n=1 Tax=uncultured Cohaesibacter sp. TaxID=1002546 RepID=UPI0029C95C0A|nr:FecR domain-containing protein [uncultured Cohaesibacter sp.]
MTSKEAEEKKALFEEAADWLLILNDAPVGKPLPERFSKWLATSQDHRRAWHSVNSAWNMLDVSISNEVNHQSIASDECEGGMSVQPFRKIDLAKFLSIPNLAILLVVGLTLLLITPSFLIWLRADYSTASAQIDHIHLSDGSVVDLGGKSAIKADMDGDHRAVRLLSGEAFFDVAKDAKRLFVLDAQGLELHVTGTAFDVRTSSLNTAVALLEGSLEVFSNQGQWIRQLQPGEMLEQDHETGAIKVNSIEPSEIGAWRDGQVFLNDVSVGFVAEMIQRYHTAWISIPDRELAAFKVSGLFDLNNPDDALSALVQPFGGKVYHITSLARVITR